MNHPAKFPTVPGVPTRIPITPKVRTIVVGLVLCAAAAWLLLSWLPSKAPISDVEALVRVARGEVGLLDEWRFKPWAHFAAQALAVLLGMAGISGVIRGATYRAHRELTCRRCRVRVVGAKVAFGVQCPRGSHLAAINRAAVLGVILGVLVVLIVVTAVSRAS